MVAGLSLILLGVLLSSARAQAFESPPTPVSGLLSRLDDRTWQVTAVTNETESPSTQISLPFGLVFALDETPAGRYVLPSNENSTTLEGHGACWVLPSSPLSMDASWEIRGEDTQSPIAIDLNNSTKTCRIIAQGGKITLRAHRARPHADIDGNEFSLGIPGGDTLADAFAGFYWGTMLPCVVERTLALEYPISDGFVVSTLASKYVGTYPDVDHEFQIKGRIAVGGDLDLDVVRRMLELEFRLMREDPCELWRAPCAIQPNGDREYHVRRNSMDEKANANMFLVTGNVEVVESVWLYVSRTKNLKWLAANIENVENAAQEVEDMMDTRGRLWGDVYYEDQVIKDGRETLAAALAARSFEILAELEAALGRSEQADHYKKQATSLAKAIGEPLPIGYWDPQNGRFVDWVDRSGIAHDHMHLLANLLPVLFGYTSTNQTNSVMKLVDRELQEFQRFPTFLSARIANYSQTEIGDGGPYDLCAAGRYWAWDATFWAAQRNGNLLMQQLEAVAKMGEAEDYIMGERYDMNHVYYADDDLPWHGAAHYYEYPCVFSWVLFVQFLGLRPTLQPGVDIELRPMLVDVGKVTLHQEAYQLSYEVGADGTFTLQNLAASVRTFQLSLDSLYPQGDGMTVHYLDTGEETAFQGEPVELAPGARLSVVPWTSSRQLYIQQ